MLTFHSRTAFALLLVATTACSSTTGTRDESTDPAEAALTVDPSGPNGRATVTVNVPSWVPMSLVVKGVQYRYALSFNGTPVTPGQPTLVAPAANPGNWGCLDIELTGGARTLQHECVWQLASGGNLTIDLGVAKIWWSGYPRNYVDFAIDEPGAPSLARTWQDHRYRLASWDGGTNELPYLLIPGDYVYSVANAAFPPIPFTVNAGKQIDINVDYDAFMAHAKVTYAAAVYPDAFVQAPQVRCVNVLGQTATSHYFFRHWSDMRVLLDRSAVDCELLTADERVSTPLQLTGGETTNVTLGRIDVDDVRLTDEQNRVVPGTWNVRPKDGDWIFPTELPTSRGIDLPSGSYEVRVSYPSAVGQKTLTYPVQLP